MPAGPVPMSLGRFKFYAAAFSLTDVSRTLETPWRATPVADRLHPLQWTGPTSEKVALKGVLFPIEFGGIATLEGLRAAAERGQAMQLVSAEGRFFGRFALERVGEERSAIDALGRPWKLSYTLDLARLGPPAAAAPTAQR